MTLPSERRQNMKNINNFLNNIWSYAELRRVSRKDKARLVRFLGRHYPADYQIDEMCDLYDQKEFERRIPLCECGAMMLVGLNGKYYCYDCFVREYELSKKVSSVPERELAFGKVLCWLWLRVQAAIRRVAGFFQRHNERQK